MDSELIKYIEMKKYAHSFDTNDKLVNGLWLKADNILPMIISKPSITIEAKFGKKRCCALIDTRAQSNIMTLETAQKFGIDNAIDRNIGGKMVGCGSSEMIGIIPYINIIIDEKKYPINITIISDLHANRHDIILGQSFLIFYNAILDFQNMQISIKNNKLPFYLN